MTSSERTIAPFHRCIHSCVRRSAYKMHRTAHRCENKFSLRARGKKEKKMCENETTHGVCVAAMQLHLVYICESSENAYI